MSRILFLSCIIFLGCTSSKKDNPKSKVEKKPELVEEQNASYCHLSPYNLGDTLRHKISGIKTDEYHVVYEIQDQVNAKNLQDLHHELVVCFPEAAFFLSEKQLVMRYTLRNKIIEKSFYLKDSQMDYRERFLPYK